MRRLFTFIVAPSLLILAFSLLAVDYAGKYGTQANLDRTEIRETDASLADSTAPPDTRLPETVESKPHVELLSEFGSNTAKVLPAMPPSELHLERSTLAFRVQVATAPRDLAGLDPEQRIGQLTITGGRFSNGSLKPLQGMSVVSISIEAANISNTGLIYLAKVKGLRELRLWTPGITDDGLRTIAQMSDLVLLDLEGTNMQGTGLEHLNTLEKLAKLTLGPNTRDQEIGLLRTFAHLEDLDLRSCRRLTDACAEPIGQIHGLRVIWLPTQLNAVSKKMIGESLPNCRLGS